MPRSIFNEKRIPYKKARKSIEHGDLLLFRRRGLISIAGRGLHSHAAKAAWWDDDLFCLEIREFLGGRAVSLSSQVKRFPGKIDVFEANPQQRWEDYNREGAVRYMRRLTGCDYGWWNLLGAAVLHLPLVRLFAKPQTDDVDLSRRPPFCSQAVAMSERLGGGIDPVCHLADRLTEPADLTRSPFYRYRFTLE